MPSEHRQSSTCSRSERLQLFGVPLLLLLAAAISLCIDISVATYFKHGRYPKEMAELFENAEPFGHGIGVSLVIAAVVLLDPEKRSRMGWLIGGSLGAGMVANTLKLFVARSRPRAFELPNGNVWQTFIAWLPGKSTTSIQSIPSAHTATAVGFAIVLATWYPRGRWLFATLAVLVGMHRLQSSAHFPSDVFAGAAIGWFIGSCCRLGDRRMTTSGAHADAGSG